MASQDAPAAHRARAEAPGAPCHRGTPTRLRSTERARHLSHMRPVSRSPPGAAGAGPAPDGAGPPPHPPALAARTAAWHRWRDGSSRFARSKSAPVRRNGGERHPLVAASPERASETTRSPALWGSPSQAPPLGPVARGHCGGPVSPRPAHQPGHRHRGIARRAAAGPHIPVALTSLWWRGSLDARGRPKPNAVPDSASAAS